jgi:hypothetical protein
MLIQKKNLQKKHLKKYLQIKKNKKYLQKKNFFKIQKNKIKIIFTLH